MKKLNIVRYSPEFKDAFKAINVEWLEEMFEVEPYDLEVLNDPQKFILNRKGNIWIALKGYEPIGTIALMELDDSMFELTKMGVSKKARGLGAGRKLLDYIVTNVFDAQKNTYFLLTSSHCKAAIHLYEQFGFEHDEAIRLKYGFHYKRCDVGMIYNS